MPSLLPYSKNKRYLTGIDWILKTLDYLTKKETGTGNVSQLVMEINATIDASQLETSLRDFLALHPIVSGHCKRDFNLAPYWFIPKHTNMQDFELLSFQADDRNEVFRILTDEVNKPFRNKHQHLAFTIIKHENKSFFAFKFDHQILDARGAEMFLDKFNSFIDTGKNSPVKLTEPAHLDLWKERFRSGQKVNRMLLGMRSNTPPAAIPLPGKKGSRKSTYSFKTYSKEETDAISSLADEKAGYLMMLPYLLGNSVCCMRNTFSDKGLSEGLFVVPTNLDARSRASKNEDLFFNNISFQFFKFNSSPEADIKSLWTETSSQFYEATKSDISNDIAKACVPMRIFPVPLLGKLMKLPLGGNIASFSFSFIGKSGYSQNQFMKHNIENIIHMPRVPCPPGIGLFFTKFNGKLNIVLSFLDGMLSKQDVDLFMSRLDAITTTGNTDERL